MIRLGRLLPLRCNICQQFSGCLSRHVFSTSVTPYAQYSPLQRARRYLQLRYLHYLRSFERLMETHFPAAFRMYHVFKVGTGSFLSDLKQFIRLHRQIQRNGFHGLSRQQLEVYNRTPADIRRLTPLLLLSALPFAQNVVYPLAYIFPRQLLSRHFWTLQQCSEFDRFNHRQRTGCSQQLLQHLQSKVDSIQCERLSVVCMTTLNQLASGFQPTPDQITSLHPLFTAAPYGLTHISWRHISCLLRLHGIRRSRLWRRSALREHGRLLRHMDAAMLQEQISDMSMAELSFACYMRGLNAQNLSREQMASWLSMWARVSVLVPATAVSLLLHCPLLLAYSHPNNWR